MLLNGLAAAKMHAGQFEEAEGYLQEALTKVGVFIDDENFVLNAFNFHRPQPTPTLWPI